jgi:hypothetical protein
MVDITMHSSPSSLLLAFGLIGLVSCGSKSGPEAAVPPVAPVSETGATKTTTTELPRVPDNARWKHATAITSHLEFGGQSFSYSSHEELHEMIVGLLGFAEKAIAASAPEGQAFRLVKPYEELGISGLAGSGRSMRKSGKQWHHRGIWLMPEGRKGLMALAGGEPKPWLAGQLTPKDTDVVVEMNLDILAGYEMVQRILETMGGGLKAESDRMLAETPLPESPQKICEMLSGRQLLFLELDKKRKTIVPESKGEFPGVDFAIAMESKALVVYLIEQISEMDEQTFEIQKLPDGVVRVASKEPMVPMDETLKPAALLDPNKGLVILASSPAYLARIEATTSKLPESADFQTASRDLPAEGNALFYVSGKFQDELTATIVQLARAEDTAADPKMVKEIEEFLIKLAIPDAQGQMLVVASQVEGLVWGANLSFSDVGLLIPAITVSSLATIGFTAFTTARETADVVASISNAKEIAVAMMIFATDNGDKLPDNLDGLVAGKYLADAMPLMIKHRGEGPQPVWQLLAPGANLSDLPAGAPILASSLPLPDKFVVALADGSVHSMTPEEFQEAMDTVRKDEAGDEEQEVP